MNAHQLASKLGVTTEILQFYITNGFLTPVKKNLKGDIEYGRGDMQRLHFVLSARQLGFSVDDIGLIIKEADKGGRPSPLVKSLINQRLHETEKQFTETIALREQMKSALKEWQDKPGKNPTGNMVNHLIESFTLE